jgi:dipicolinate synthase subunit A
MGKTISVILGGDARELRIAERLLEIGHEVRIFGLEKLPNPPVPYSSTAIEAVTDAQWLICPGPGINGDALYAPFATNGPILLDEALLSASNVIAGGLILGKASKTVLEVQKKLNFKVIESKDERHLVIANSTTVSEGLIKLLIENTPRTLREYKYTILGYGATGAAFTDFLIALGCEVTVAARSKVAQERARQCGAQPIAWDDRLTAMKGSQIVINTVPDVEAVSKVFYPELKNVMIVDIASPPGGMDHDLDEKSGLNIIWGRGLGNRAPHSTGDIRFGFIEEVLKANQTK